MGETTIDTGTSADRTAELDGILASIFLTQEGKQDPYPGYAAVREHVAVHQSAFGVKVATRYDDINATLRDNHFGRGDNDFDPSVFGMTAEEFEARFPRELEFNGSMLSMDPPDHTRLRGLVAKAFTPKTVEQLRPEIANLTDGFLGALPDDGTTPVDLMAELALKLPITVISQMLGVPGADHAALLPHIRVLLGSLANFGPPDLEKFAAMFDAGKVVGDYFRELAAEKRKHPDDGMFTALVHAEEEGDKLTESELIGTVILLFVAGYETTTNLIGNGTRALLLHADQLDKLRADRSLMKGTIEEILRWDSPVQLTARRALADGLKVGDTPVASGEEVIVILGAANHDPRVYGEDADAFDITRNGPAPLSFSAGIHYCLGAALARAEGDILFDRLLDTFATIEPAWGDTLTYRDNLVLRGLEALPVTLARS
jgi:cytochrome P450